MKTNLTVHVPESSRSRREPQTAHLRRSAATLLAGGLLLSCAACVTIPDDRNLLPQQDVARAQLATDIKLAREGWPQAQWWTRYNDPQLNRLVAQALQNGPTLQIAAARVSEARAALQHDTSDKGPNVGLNATTSRTLYSAEGFFPPPIGGSYYTETTVEAVAQYDFDWWGKHKAAIAAALGEVNARRADYAQAEQTLAAAIAQSYFNLQGARTRLVNLQDMLTLQRTMLADNEKRIANGVANNDGEHLAQVGVAMLEQQIAQREAYIASEREALRALLGADNHALADIAVQPLPQALPALPSNLGIELLARRPDLQAARWRVEASLDQIDSAKAAFYPDINLSAYFGSDVLSLDKLFNAAARTMSIAPTLTLPLFDSGRLKASLEAVRSQRNEMIADYNQSVFNAVREVAQAGIGLQAVQRQIDRQADAETAAAAFLHSTEARFKHGLTNRNTMLVAELAVREEQDTGLQLKNQLLLADVALIKALGGGYQAVQADAAPKQ